MNKTVVLLLSFVFFVSCESWNQELSSMRDVTSTRQLSSSSLQSSSTTQEYDGVSYLSDFWDDLLQIYPEGNYKVGKMDVYIAPMKTQGVRKLILWDTGHFFTPWEDTYCKETHEDYDLSKCEAWKRHQKLSDAWIESSEINRVFSSWKNVYILKKLQKSKKNILQELKNALKKYQVELQLSFRPQEMTLSTYYKIPIFKPDGEFLSYYYPFGDPVLYSEPEKYSKVHHRGLFNSTGDLSGFASLGTFQIPGGMLQWSTYQKVTEDDFTSGKIQVEFYGYKLPDLSAKSFGFVEDQDSFSLRKNEPQKIKNHQKNKIQIFPKKIEFHTNHKGILITGLELPADYPFLKFRIYSNDSSKKLFMKLNPRSFRLWSKKGQELGRFEHLWKSEKPSSTPYHLETADFQEDGKIRSFTFLAKDFEMIQRDVWTTLDGLSLWVNFGDLYTPELVDYGKAESRSYLVKKVISQMKWMEVEKLSVDPRSHSTTPQGSIFELDRNHLWFGYAPRKLIYHPDFIQEIQKGGVESFSEVKDLFLRGGEDERTSKIPCNSVYPCKNKIRMLKHSIDAWSLEKWIEEYQNLKYSAYVDLPQSVFYQENQSSSATYARNYLDQRISGHFDLIQLGVVPFRKVHAGQDISSASALWTESELNQYFKKQKNRDFIQSSMIKYFEAHPWMINTKNSNESVQALQNYLCETRKQAQSNGYQNVEIRLYESAYWLKPSLSKDFHFSSSECD